MDQGRWRYTGRLTTTSLLGQYWPCDAAARCDTLIYNQFCCSLRIWFHCLSSWTRRSGSFVRSKISNVSTQGYILPVTSTLGQGSIYFSCHTKTQRKPIARPLLRFGMVQVGQVTFINIRGCIKVRCEMRLPSPRVAYQWQKCLQT